MRGVLISEVIPPPSGLQRLHSRLSYHDVPVAHIASYPFQRPMRSLSSTQQPVVRGVVTPQAPERSTSEPGVHADGGGVPPPLMRQQSLSGTGRVQAVRRELKPDLWKIAYKGIQQLMSQSSPVGVVYGWVWFVVYGWVCTCSTASTACVELLGMVSLP